MISDDYRHEKIGTTNYFFVPIYYEFIQVKSLGNIIKQVESVYFQDLTYVAKDKYWTRLTSKCYVFRY
jgi:hypothetical protein